MILNEPPPDLTISAGHRSVAVVRALRQRAHGRTRSIHVGFPRISPGHFDLVVATPQYPIPDHPKLLRIPYALTRMGTKADELSDQAPIHALPPPRQLLIVGGPTLFWNLDEDVLRQTLAGMIDEAAGRGGSMLVTTSPRTPRSLRDAIAMTLSSSEVPSLLAVPGKPPPYAALLDAAESIRITADSVAMTSDAIWTGKPLALVPIAKSALGNIAMGMADRLRRPLYPQDLRRFWTAIREIGISENPAVPRTSTDEQMRGILERVHPILESLG